MLNHYPKYRSVKEREKRKALCSAGLQSLGVVYEKRKALCSTGLQSLRNVMVAGVQNAAGCPVCYAGCLRG